MCVIFPSQVQFQVVCAPQALVPIRRVTRYGYSLRLQPTVTTYGYNLLLQSTVTTYGYNLLLQPTVTT